MYLQPLSGKTLFSWLLKHTRVAHILKGIYFRDTLPKVHHYQPALYIVNTSLSSNPLGEHWIGLLLGVETCEYYDSLGQEPHNDIVHILGTNYIYSAVRLQDINIPTCGYYVLMYSYCTAHGMNFEQIIEYMYGISDDTIVETVHQLSTSLSS